MNTGDGLQKPATHQASDAKSILHIHAEQSL